MRWLALPAAALLVAAACGAPRSQADQDKDGKLVAGAIKAADSGSTFSMDEMLVLTGGDIPQGQQATIHAQATGSAKAGNVKMTYKILGSKQALSFDMRIVDDQLYVRPNGAATWRQVAATTATALFPTVRLPLVRESVLLAKSVSPYSLANVNNGFSHKYAVKPATDQLEQLQSIPVQGTAETVFLKSASAEVDAFLSLSGNKLSRLEVHLTGTDPATGTKQKIDSTLTVKAAGVADISAPATSTPVDPSQILTTS